MESSQRRELSRDLNRSGGGYELAVVVVLFTLGGLALDRWLGLVPLFTIVLTLLGAFGAGVKIWVGYDRQMRRLEQEGPWATHS